jgi:hypothetical protein
MPYCPNCGSETEADAAFCGSCGAQLEGEAPPPPPSPPARQGPRGSTFAALLALILLAAGGVALYDQASQDGEWRHRLFGGGEDQKVVAGPSPTTSAAPTATAAAPSATASPLVEPTATRAPTATARPTALPPTPPPAPTAPAPSPIPPAPGNATPEEAIGVYLDQYKVSYAGDCASADLATDVGSFCSTLWGKSNSGLVYLAGLAFSEPESWLLLADQGGDSGWLVVDQVEVVPGPQGLVPPWP